MGWQGYGIFWGICEMLRSSTNCIYKKNDIDCLALSIGVDADYMQGFVALCLELGLFVEDKIYFWSERMQRDVESMKKKSRIASDNAYKRWGLKDIDNEEDNTSLDAKDMQQQCHSNAIAMQGEESKGKDIKGKEGNKPAKAVSISAFISDLPDLERSLCERFIKHRKLIKQPVASIVGVKGFLRELKGLTEDQTLWPVIMDEFEQKEWQSVKWVKLEETTTKETPHIAYEYACCMAGVKTEKERRWFLKEITKYPPEFIGVLAFYWKNAHDGEMKKIIEQHLIEEWADKKRYYGNYNRKTQEEHIAHWTEQVRIMKANTQTT